MLKLKGKQCVIVGGGEVATRKIQTLLEAEASITVISPKVTNTLANLATSNEIEWLNKKFEAPDLYQAFLIVAATNDKYINKKVVDSAKPHQLINVVDSEEMSNYIVPSTFHRGKLTMAVSTHGTSPGLAQKIKNELATKYDEAYEEYVEFLYKTRDIVKKEVKNPVDRKYIFKQLLNEAFLQLTREKQYEQREAMFYNLLRGGDKS